MALTKEEFLQIIARLADVLWEDQKVESLTDEELVQLRRSLNGDFYRQFNNLKQVRHWLGVESLRRWDVNFFRSLSAEELIHLRDEGDTPSWDESPEFIRVLEERGLAQAPHEGEGHA